MNFKIAYWVLCVFLFKALAAQDLPYGKDFQINTSTAGDQFRPSVAALTDGGFVINWISYDGFVYAQIYNMDGSKRGEAIMVNTETNYSIFNADVVALTGGDFFCVLG